MEYLTEDKIRIIGRFTIQNIRDVEIKVRTNEHPTIYVRGIIPAEIGMEEIKDKCFKERIALVELDENGNEKDEVIFDGIILNAKVKEEGNFFEVEINGVSASYIFDIEKKKQSFQNVNMTYSDVIKSVIGAQKVIFTTGSDKKIGKPLIQYEETDWEFARRLASHFNKPIQSDIVIGNPRIWFGIRNENTLKEYERLFDTNTYRVGISDKYYEVGSKLGLSKKHFIYYKFKDGRNFHIGDRVLFQDKKLIICEKDVKFEKGELVFYYTLARENYLSVPEYYNELFTGLSLLGAVIKTDRETVWLKLDIDGKNGEYPYKWAPTSGSLMYCMPKVNTKASLYFGNADERCGIATNSPRTNGGNDKKSTLDFDGFSNVQNRGMVTEHGKRMDMYPDLMRFSATGEVDKETGEIIKPLELLFNDDTGILAESHKSLKLIAFNNIKIESNQSTTFQSPILVNVLRSNRYAELMLASIVTSGTYKMMKMLNEKKAGVELALVPNDTTLVLNNRIDSYPHENIVYQVTSGTYKMMKMLNEKKAGVELALVPNDTTLVLNNRIDSYPHENIVYQARIYAEYELFDDAPRERKKTYFGEALVALGAIATVALIGLAIVATGPIITCALAGAAVFTGAATINIANNMDNYNSWEDFLGGVLFLGFSALQGAIRGAILSASITGMGVPNIFSVCNPRIWKSLEFIGVGMQTTIMLNELIDAGTGKNLGKELLGEAGYFMLDAATVIMSSPTAMAGLIKQFPSNATNIGEALGLQTSLVEPHLNSKNTAKSGNTVKLNEPIDAITGSFLIDQCDLIINDISGEVAVERFYESIYKEVSPIGKGWNLSIFSHLEFESDFIRIHMPDNKIEVFKMEDGHYENICLIIK